jgi:hypothetical protein
MPINTAESATAHQFNFRDSAIIVNSLIANYVSKGYQYKTFPATESAFDRTTVQGISILFTYLTSRA